MAVSDPAGTSVASPERASSLRLAGERALARALMSLPGPVQVRLSGRPPVQIDGQTLTPETQLTLALLARRGEDAIETLTPEQARLMRRRTAALYGGRARPVGAVGELSIPAEQPLRARHYAPLAGEEGRGMIVFFHGGGFVFGDLDTHDSLCRELCRHAGAHVLAIDYRLAPEHPFPAAVEDAETALRWAFANAQRLGADPARIGVCGDSAGGNLAAVACQLAARAGGPQPAMQLLIYPVTDFTGRRRSRELFGEGFFLTNANMDWFDAQYLGPGRAYAADPRASPMLAGELSGLAPALVVTAAFDPLRDEGEEYAQALRAAGTPAILRRVPGVIHGFVSALGVSASARDAVVEMAGGARAMLAAASPG